MLWIVNIEVHETIWQRPSTTIQYTFTPVWIVEPVLSLVTGHASLLYYSCTLHTRTPYASWLLENRFSVDPALTYHFSFSTSPLLSLLLSFSLDRWPPASYTKTTGFLLSRRRFAMRSWFLSRAVKMHVSY